MKLACVIVAGTALVCVAGSLHAQAQYRSTAPRKEPIEVRLIALAVAYPRSSFFANDEVFVAEQELAKDESRFVKVVYDFLPYQQPLSSSGLNYSLVHRFRAVRDTSCDENLWQMRWLYAQRQTSSAANSEWKYSAQSPIFDLDRRQARLRCYRVSSDDYEKASREPTSEIAY